MTTQKLFVVVGSDESLVPFWHVVRTTSAGRAAEMARAEHPGLIVDSVDEITMLDDAVLYRWSPFPEGAK